jgi:hypothetical protein
MMYVRRFDLSWVTRLELACRMLSRGFDSWGLVTDLAKRHRVCRQFLYDNLAEVKLMFSGAPQPGLDNDDEWTHRLILALRLFCDASLDGISNVLREMGLAPCSTGHISGFLSGVGACCKLDIPSGGPPRTVLVDETFIGGIPILVVMDALSHCILSITLAPDRTKETWTAELRKLIKQGVAIGLLVKDQGGSLKAAAVALGIPERGDLFHLLYRFDPILGSLESRAYGAIHHEAERLHVHKNRKTMRSRRKSAAKFKAASNEAARAVRASDDYDYLHKCLHEAFDSFAADGCPRGKSIAEGDIEAALALLEEEFPSHEKIQDAVRFLRKNLVDYWGYFEELERIVNHHGAFIPEHTLRAVCLAWQLARKAMAVKCPESKKELARQSKDQMELATTGGDGKLMAFIESLRKELDSNVRSSSPLEAVNSVIRDYLNSCRGQTTQDALTLLAYFLNHRQATRGKYKGTSPYVRMTDIQEDASPIQRILGLSPRSVKWKASPAPKPFPRAGLLEAS